MFKSEGPYSNLQPDLFAERIRSDSKAVVLDVRTSAEYKSGKIAKSVLIDFMRGDFISEIQKLDKNKNFYVYCRSGARSAEACRKMHSSGFKQLYNLSGGIMSYKGDII
ncbi:MAG: rhodanese-like domain-containing protein [Bacteroidetes bacterium]|nr:MAG: rhodanese-like domain-containing protein [Bacteroidota bacterium]REK05826.1 MAG: rhodanese-like domain-containing protein [Bacteroidota bacterium]REK32038.1 MAG: rhodanese-like domain-containing protein [Bacteroidota bacterium]REK50103.1 MAG: rhodanese-like domain-containing protein [Bacteroidota bacterium]